MADAQVSDIRASVQRIRTEGVKLVERLRDDARAIVTDRANTVTTAIDDLRKRATERVEQLLDTRTRTEAVVADVAQRVAGRLGIATAKQVSALAERLEALAQQIESITKSVDKAA